MMHSFKCRFVCSKKVSYLFAYCSMLWSFFNRLTYMFLCVLIFLFYNLYTYVELIPIQFLTTFTVKYLGFPVTDASMLLSVFYGCHFGGRILGIPVSAFLRPQTMMIIDLSLTAIAYLLLIAFVNTWPAIVWPSAALAGLGMATTFPTGVLWISEAIPVTGFVASLMVFGYAVGGMVGPLFVGRLFESSTPMWFVYVVVAASVSHVVMFFGLMAYVRRFTDNLKRVTKKNRIENEEIRITSVIIDDLANGVDKNISSTKVASEDTELNEMGV
jgi:MFS family permease